jgi:hypothetical protein
VCRRGVVEQLLKMKMSKFIPGIMTRENIVDNVFILYGDQIGMIKYSLAFHKYTITNIMEHFARKRDLERKNV